MSNARSTAASRQRAKFAESPDEARLVDAANLTGEHDRVEPAAALARTDERLVRIESRPRARGHRSNDGGGSRAVNRLRFPLFVTRSSSSTVALGSVMLRRPYARVDAFMRIIPMLHTTDVDPHDPCCRHAVAPTLPRLLRWLLVDGPDPANVAKRAESARAACPRGAGRLQGLLAVLAGDLEGRTAAGGGWVRRRGRDVESPRLRGAWPGGCDAARKLLTQVEMW